MPRPIYASIVIILRVAWGPKIMSIVTRLDLGNKQPSRKQSLSQDIPEVEDTRDARILPCVIEYRNAPCRAADKASIYENICSTVNKRVYIIQCL